MGVEVEDTRVVERCGILKWFLEDWLYIQGTIDPPESANVEGPIVAKRQTPSKSR